VAKHNTVNFIFFFPFRIFPEIVLLWFMSEIELKMTAVFEPMKMPTLPRLLKN
jgi:hypothetical protein